MLSDQHTFHVFCRTSLDWDALVVSFTQLTNTIEIGQAVMSHFSSFDN